MSYSVVFMLYILLVSSIIMFISAATILALGYKNKTPNYILWGLLPLFKAFEWLIEFMSDYIEEILDEDPPFIFDRMEITLAFAAAFVVLAACIEFNGIIEKPIGKITAGIPLALRAFYLWVLEPDVFDAIEDNIIFGGGSLISDPNRFSYGFLVPIMGVGILIALHILYLRQVKKGKISKNEKMSYIVLIIAVLIIIPTFFNGFDYTIAEDVEDPIFLLLRGFTIGLTALLPLIIVFSSGLELQQLVIIKGSGIPIFVYNFNTQSDIEPDDKTLLASGFLTALMSFSTELAEKESNLIAVRSSNLYYILYKSSTNLYALQSLHYQKSLDNKFLTASQKIEKILKGKEKISAVDRAEIGLLIRESI